MKDIFEEIGKIGILPDVTINNEEKATSLAKALTDGGIPCAEINVSESSGLEAIRKISTECPNFLVGAGHITATAQVDEAIDTGAKFIVSLGFEPDVVKYCIRKYVTVIPEVANQHEIELAVKMGLKVVKLSDAELLGGANFIETAAKSYEDVKFIAGKNIAEKKLAEYFGCENVLACSSEWIATSLHIDNDEFDKITELCKKAIFASLELKVKHIGINNDKADDAVKTAEFLGNIFGFVTKEGPASVFATNAIELMKSPGPGTKGHIGISAVNVPRAIAYLERTGVEIDTNTFRYDAKGNVNFVYLKEELCGFAIHLVNNIPNIQNI